MLLLVAPALAGARLDVFRAGDVAVLQDPDGEWYQAYVASNLSVDWLIGSCYDAFFDHFDDDYQFLVILTLDEVSPTTYALYQPWSNDVRGLGYAPETFDYDLHTGVEGVIFLHDFHWWNRDEALGRYVFEQELMHRWGAFVSVDHEGLDPGALLGRDGAHWSYWLDTPNSPMEGNRWTDNGDGTFTTDTSSSTYSDLDLYLMGLLPPEDVGPQRLLVPTGDTDGRDATSMPAYQGGGRVTVAADTVDVTVDDVIAAEGPRDPPADASPRSFRVAFLVLAIDGDAPGDHELETIDALRTSFAADWEQDVRGLATLDTTLGDGDAPDWGEAPVEDDSFASYAQVKDDGGCGCGSTGSGGLGGTLGAALGALALATKRRR